MSKIIIIIVAVLVLVSGFLYYDWHKKTHLDNEEMTTDLYAWTGKDGAKHYSNTPPEINTQNVEIIKGVKHIEPPIVVQIQNQAGKLYENISKTFSNLINKRKDGKKKKKTGNLIILEPSQTNKTDNQSYNKQKSLKKKT